MDVLMSSLGSLTVSGYGDEVTLTLLTRLTKVMAKSTRKAYLISALYDFSAKRQMFLTEQGYKYAIEKYDV